MVRLLSYTTTTWIKNINVSDNFDHFRLSIWKLKLKAKLYFTDVTCSSISYSNCFPHVVFTFSGVQSSSEPRGSQSGRKKRRDESFQVRAKEPLATDSHRTISKNSSGCRLLIGHKKCFVLLCPIGEQFLLSSFREFVHDGYCLATLARFVHQACACKGNFYFLLS